jgi:hypothetical protein
MKKTIIAISAVVALGISSYGQWYIEINNFDNSGTFGSWTDGFHYSPLVTHNGLFFTTDTAAQAQNISGGEAYGTQMGQDFSFALYGGATAGTVTTLIGSFTGAAIAGDNYGWGQLQGPSGAAVIPGSSPLSTVYLQIFAWEGSTYATFAAALGNTWAGSSGVFSNPSSSSASNPIIPSLSGMPDVILMIPEPSTIALAGLGGLSLLLIRRRK